MTTASIRKLVFPIDPPALRMIEKNESLTCMVLILIHPRIY